MSKRVVLIALLAVLFLSSAAMADTLVNYATQGSFANLGAGWTGAGTNSITNGSLTLTFTGIGNFPTNPSDPSTGSSSTWITLTDHLDGATDWSTAQLGMFQITGSGSALLPEGASFTVDVYQFAPPSTDVSSADSVSFHGTISYSSGGPAVIFGQPSFTWANSTTYTATQPPLSSINWGVQSVTPLNPGSNGQETSLNGIAYTPEPASMMLFGTGLVGLAGVVRRRLRK